jgi:hypothetical protein
MPMVEGNYETNKEETLKERRKQGRICRMKKDEINIEFLIVTAVRNLNIVKRKNLERTEKE